MQQSATSSTLPPDGTASVERDAAGRIVKKLPVWEPLEQERRYVQPHVSHVSVFTGFFSWAVRANRLGKFARQPVKIQSFRRNGVGRSRPSLASYFSLGTAQDLRPRDAGEELHIRRNRMLFLGLLAAVVVYSLVWMAR
jgi:hypothetical protein